MATKEKKPRKSNKLTAVPKPRKPKKVTLLDVELEPLKEAESILTDVEEAEARAEEAALRVEMAKESYQTSRLAYKDAVGQLRKLCRARKEKHPLFDQAAKKPEEKPAETKPGINWNRPRDAVTIELTEDCADVDPQLVKGNTYHPWGVGTGCITLLLGGVEMFVDDGRYRITTGADLVDQARQQNKAGLDASQWDAWLRARPECKQTPPASTNPQVNEDWKALPLEAAKINGRGGKLLVEAGYETLGAVAKLMRDYGQWWNKEVKGIGEETAAEIADRFADFWAAHPEYCQQAEAC